MAGDDPIMAVSRMFADLADEGGAAADSFATINSILSTSLNRTMLRFGKAMNDSVKSIQAFNVGLKTASKRVSANVTQRQSAKMGAASQASEAIHRTQAFQQNKQVNRQLNAQNIQTTLDEVNESIRNSLVNALDEFANKLNDLIPIMQVFSGVLGAITSVFSAATLKNAVDASKRSGAFSKTQEELAKEKEYEKQRYKTPAERVSTVESNAQKGLEEINDKIKTEETYINGIKNEQKKLAAEYKNLMNGVSTLGKTPAELSNLFDNLNERLDKAKTYLSKLQTSKSGIEQALPQQKAEAATKTISDVIMSVKNGTSGMASNIVKFVGALKASTVLMAGSFAAAIGFVIYKLYDFGKNAIPRLTNYLLKPLQTVYEFVNGPLNQAFSKVTSFVSVLNPAYGEQANRALEDLSAVIGKILLPVFNSMIYVLKFFTSSLFKNLNIFSGVMQNLAKLIATAGNTIIENFFTLLKDAQPLFDSLVQALSEALPVINDVLVSLFKELRKHIPTFNRAIKAIGMMLDMYLKQKMQEFANNALLASRAAQNQARAMELFGSESMTLANMFNNLGYYISDLMLQLDGVFIELMGWAAWFMGRKSDLTLSKTVENLVQNPLTAHERGNLALAENVGLVTATGTEEEMKDLNFMERAGAKTRKWIASLFGAEDLPWVENKRKIEEEKLNGAFDVEAMAEEEQPFEEGFAGKGAAFQEIGQLGKNLAAASFGMGDTIPAQSLEQLKQINANQQAQLQNQQQFRGNVPVQGVR